MNPLVARIAALAPEKRALLVRQNPLSFAQRRLWFLDQLEPGSASYNVPAALGFAGPLDVGALRRSYAASVARHAILRTALPAFDGEPMQLVLPPGTPGVAALPEIDLTALPPALAQAAARALADDEAGRPFDLARGPLIRAALLRVAPEEAIFLLNMHHIISDGWSQDLLIAEMTEVYAGAVAGRTVALPPLPIQFGDYARWQRSFLAGEKAAAQLAVWRRRLAGCPPQLELPADRPFRPGGRHEGGTVGETLPADLTARLEDLGRRHGASLFMVGLAGFAVLLSRLAGVDDVVVGTPIVNRAAVDAERLIGIFLNMLALRADTSGRPSFAELLARVRAATLEAYDNQDLPFEMLVEELEPERLMGVHPLFQVVFTLVARPAPRMGEVGFAVSAVELGGRTAKYDLSLAAVLLEGQLRVGFEHDLDRIDRATAERWLGSYITLLTAADLDAGRPAAELPLLGPAEQWQVVAEWNDTDWQVGPASLLERIERRADAAPDAVALVYEGAALTCRELDRAANRLAHRLAAAGVGTDDRVQICLERSLDLIVAVLATVKAGAAFVPLDPGYPADRLAYIAEDSAGKAVVTRGDHAHLFPGRPAPVILLDREAARLAEAPDSRLGRAIHPEQLLFVLYTSGSTGRPKGTMNTHGGMMNRELAEQAMFPVSPRDVLVQKTPVTFDVSVWEYFWPLWTGARLVVLRPEGHRDLPYLIDLYAREGVTVCHFVPSMLRLFLEHQGVVRVPALRQLFGGGEAMTVELAAELARQAALRPPGSPVVLTNLYGPAEASIDVTTFRCAGEAGRTTVPIGRPIPGARLLILDRELRPVPIGVAGQIAIGGAPVGRGYLGRPELTAEKFVPDPTKDRSDRLYLTGDKGRLLPLGDLEFLGRLDFQVKIRGVRVEPGEVEAALLGHPAVAQAAVIARPGAAGLELAAFVVAAATPGPSPAELRAHLRQLLPETMVPSTFTPLAALPLSPNAKVDRQALARLEVRPNEPQEEAELRSPIEEVVAGIWIDLLKVPRVLRGDNFFDLGGHSLQGIRLTAHLREALGIELPVKALFEAPTLSELARRVEEVLAAGAGRPRGAIPVLPRRDLPVPLSFAQERLWFLEELEPGAAFYNIPAAVEIFGPLQPAALAASLTAMIARHESLRTTFGQEGGRPYQRVHPPGPVPLPEIDLSALAVECRAAELARLTGEEGRAPFDLAHGPLLRFVLYRLGGGGESAGWAVSYTLHHIVSDGWSSGVLLAEIAKLYTALAAGGRPELPPLPVQYPDFAVWQREQLAGPVLAEELAWWRARLEGHAALELPTDRPRPAVETFRGAHRAAALSPELSESLAALSRRFRGTLFMALLAGFQALLAQISGQRRIAVGSPIANRNRPELEGVIGFFANTLVLSTDTGGGPSFRELFGRVKETALGAYAHEDLPFEKLVEELSPERDMSRNPLFQVMLVLQNQPRESLPAGDLSLRPLRVESGTAKFDLTIFWLEGGGQLHALVEHNRDLFDDVTAERLFARYERLLAAAAALPERPLDDLPLLAGAERHQLASEWNDTARQRPLEPVHRLVDRAARERPDAVAAVDEAGCLSYAGLVAAANRMAHGLARLGVGPEARVGVCLERSLAMAVAALAAQKAGGALVALDPAYPDDRLAAIADDAGLAVLLTQRALAARFPGHGSIALFLEPGEDRFAGLPASDPAIPVDLDHPMYLIYTSGTTGSPKGISVPHRAFASLLAWQMRSAPLAAGAAVLQFATFGFCVSFQELFTAWAAGGTLVVAGEMERRDFARLPELLAAHGIARLHLPYAALKQLAEAAGGALPADLREIVTAGEQLRLTEPLRRLFARSPGVTLENQYGASETHVVAAWKLAGDAGEWPTLPPVGRPVDNVRIHLFDERLQPVPVGVKGELAAGGDCLPRGYLNDPALTAEKLVPDPFAALAGCPGARLYRTGDAARTLASGAIEHLGRLDGQVKVRGFRVEPGEVEAVLSRHPGVADAAVVALPGPDGSRLAAYVVAAAGQAPAAEELRQHLKGKLPDYMVPEAVTLLAALPLSANGKLDAAALPPPDFVRLGGEEEAPALPASALEAALVDIWAEVLERPTVSVHGHFFELGGHSLLATRVISRVRQLLDVELPLRTLFEAPTVAAFAARLERDLAPGRAAPRIAATAPGEATAPLSFAQQRLWFIDRLLPGSAAYNLPFALHLAGPLDRAALAGSIAEIVRRHEALRTTFAAAASAGGEEVVQRVSPDGPGLPWVDLSALRERSLAEAERLVEADAAAPFDLERGPLFRPALLVLGEESHVVLGTMHHIVSDGWSLGILVRELGALYGAAVGRRPSPLPELPVSYRDFARWQRRYLAGGVLAAQLEHWRARLAGLPPQTTLPPDHPRPAVPSGRGGRLGVELDAGLHGELAALGHRLGATPFMVLLAGFAAVLGRLCRQLDVVVGSPIAGRNRAEIEGLIGFFVNTLVLPTSLAGDPDFSALVARVREGALDAFAHQDLPFERLVEELQPERDLSRHPLFQILFAVQTAAVGALELPGLAVSRLGNPRATVKFDLSLSLVPGEGDGMIVGVEWSTDLYEEATVRQLVAGYEALLRQAVAEPGRPLSSFGLLPPAAVAALAAGPLPPMGGDDSLPAAFRRQAALQGEAPAVIWGARRLSYAELDRASDRLAVRLVAAGLTPGGVAAIALPRSPELVVAMLAVVKAGGAYLPLDLEAPAARLAGMLEDAGADLLVATPATAARLGTLDVPVVEPKEGEADRSDGSGRSVRAIPCFPASAAAVMYTSGSTGRPKGAVLPHRSILALAFDREVFPLGPADRVGQIGSPAFDISILETWGALLNGACLVGLEREQFLDPRGLAAVLEAQGITFLFLATAHLREIARTAPGAFAGLDTLLFGGEAADAAWLAGIAAAGAPARLVSVYGPTETTVFVAWQPIVAPAALASNGGAVPLGRPLSRARIAAVDPHGHPLPDGLAGELWIAGEPLGSGYRNRPDRTAERFVPDPLAAVPGARAYRTGDLGRRAGGDFRFLGRLDGQVKVHGFRVEVGEVEAALAAHPGVAAAAVAALGEPPEERRLAGFWVPRQAGGPEAGELAGHLARTLPPYMVPAILLPLAELPLTSNGKVDRRALAALATGPVAAAGAGEHRPPRGPLEETVAEVWADVLGLPRVSIDDNFFALGGHSLLATRAASRLAATLGREVPLRALFEAPTLADFAAELSAAGDEGQTGALPPLPRLLPASGGRDAPAPLSFAQQRLWFLDRLVPRSPAYNLPFALRLEGPLDVAAFRAAVIEIARRHEALRTTFAAGPGGEAVQRIAPPASVAVPLIDLSALDAAAPAEAVRRVEEDAGRPFDLARGPLFRPALIRLAADDHVALGTMHHIVSDGWSLGILVRELTALYAALRARRPSPLPELPLQYRDFARWQRRVLSGERLEREIDHWRARLAGLPPLFALPADRPRPPLPSGRGGRSPIRLEPAFAAAARSLALSHGATLFMALLAGFSAFLGRLAGQERVAVGSPIAGRNRAEIEGLIGFFVNTLVLTTDLAGEPSLAELLARVREGTLDAYAHQELPFEKLVEEVAPERDLSHHPLFQVMLALQNATVGALKLPGLAVSRLAGKGAPAVKFDLTLSLSQGANGELAGSLEWSSDLFEAATAERLVAYLERFLGRAVAAPELPLAGLSLLSAEESAELAVAPTPPASPMDGELTLPALVRRQARLRGEVPAVEWGERRLSYAELDAASERLAGRLIAAGLAPAEVAAIALPRSPELVIAMLAILKAGAAYLPLDLDAPAGRSAALLADAGARLLVAQPEALASLGPVELPVVEVEDRADESVGSVGSDLAFPESPAYVLYTSGSTGRPKGVVVPHRAVARMALARDAAPIGPAGRMAQVGSPAFDASAFEIWTALLAGATLVGLEREQFLRPRELAAALSSLKITVALFTTGHVREVARQAPGAFAALDTLFFGGEAADASWLAAIRSAGPPRRLINAYGPTEAAVYVSYQPIAELVPGEPIPIGRPLAHARLLVVDHAGNPLPAGLAGELCLGGESLATGYLDRPELTAERFVPDPAAAVPGARVYRTGDLVRRGGPSAPFEFQGRLDGQVKVRGFRVEPGEVEAALAALPGVKAAAVLVAGEAPESRHLIACWSPDPAAPATEAGLRQALGRALPQYMVPSRFVALPELPRTVSGKIDRRALKGLAANVPAAAGPPPAAAPASPTAEILAGIWAELLKLARVGPEDEFFALSGHSLLAVQAMSRIERVFGVELPLRRLFEGATVAELAAEIDGAGGRAAAPLALRAIARRPRGVPLPAGFFQEWGWAVQGGSVSAFYNIPSGLRLHGSLSVPALVAALGELERRQEGLRTRLVPAGDGTLQQVIDPPGGLRLPAVDLSGLPPAWREPALQGLADEDADIPFDVSAEALLRVRLVRLGEEDHALLLNLNHLVGDGWSVGVLRAELAALYLAFAAGRPSPLPELPVQFADFAAWQREAEEEGLFAGQLAYWRRRLGASAAASRLRRSDEPAAPCPEVAPPLVLPGDFPYDPVLGPSTIQRSVPLPAEVAARLRALARAEGATPAMVILTAIKLLLDAYTGAGDIRVGSILAGRPRPELAAVIGFFMNTVVHRTDLSGRPSFREALARVRAGVLEDYRHQDLPFSRLLAELFPGEAPSRMALSRVMLNMLAFPALPSGDLAASGLRLAELRVAREHARYDLFFLGRDQDGWLALDLVAAASRFLPATVSAIVADLGELLAAATTRPEAMVDELLPAPRFAAALAGSGL